MDELRNCQADTGWYEWPNGNLNLHVASAMWLVSGNPGIESWGEWVIRIESSQRVFSTNPCGEPGGFSGGIAAEKAGWVTLRSEHSSFRVDPNGGMRAPDCSPETRTWIGQSIPRGAELGAWREERETEKEDRREEGKDDYLQICGELKKMCYATC